jgi:hypothetical protein
MQRLVGRDGKKCGIFEVHGYPKRSRLTLGEKARTEAINPLIPYGDGRSEDKSRFVYTANDFEPQDCLSRTWRRYEMKPPIADIFGQPV